MFLNRLQKWGINKSNQTLFLNQSIGKVSHDPLYQDTLSLTTNQKCAVPPGQPLKVICDRQWVSFKFSPSNDWPPLSYWWTQAIRRTPKDKHSPHHSSYITPARLGRSYHYQLYCIQNNWQGTKIANGTCAFEDASSGSLDSVNVISPPSKKSPKDCIDVRTSKMQPYFKPPMPGISPSTNYCERTFMPLSESGTHWAHWFTLPCSHPISGKMLLTVYMLLIVTALLWTITSSTMHSLIQDGLHLHFSNVLILLMVPYLLTKLISTVDIIRFHVPNIANHYLPSHLTIYISWLGTLKRYHKHLIYWGCLEMENFSCHPRTVTFNYPQILARPHLFGSFWYRSHMNISIKYLFLAKCMQWHHQVGQKLHLSALPLILVLRTTTKNRIIWTITKHYYNKLNHLNDIGHFIPASDNANIHALILVDHFTKWLEVTPLKDTSAPTIAFAIDNQWTCR